MKETNIKIISTFFVLYGVNDDKRRIAYTQTFLDVPSDILEMALKKVQRKNTNGFLPSVADIYEALDEVAEEVVKKDPWANVIKWQKIRHEIDSAVRSTSAQGLSPEAREVVNQYGGTIALFRDSEIEDKYISFVVPKLEKIFNSLRTKFNRPLLDEIISGKLTVPMIEQKVSTKMRVIENALAEAKRKYLPEKREEKVEAISSTFKVDGMMPF